MAEDLPTTMQGVLLVGHGDFEKLEFRMDIPVPRPAAGEVLIRVLAAGVNNTDINTRVGWYSKSVTTGTASRAQDGFPLAQNDDASWSGLPLAFLRIQGADCCGQIVAVGNGVDPDRIGERVLVRNMLRSYVDYRPYECWTFGSECDGGFAQYTKAPSKETYAVNCDWSDIELASIPCAYSTAEGMLHRANVRDGEHVAITGASGGVGSAAIQLAKRRGAYVTAIAGQDKAALLLELGADTVIGRHENLVSKLGKETVDVALDVAAGPGFRALLDVLRKGGRYVVAGAIAGPLVELDVRDLYLKDLSFFGCTFQDDVVFENLVAYIQRNEIRPCISKTFPLHEIAEAQKAFLSKSFVGKIVLEIPA
ncbi:alcohol dehydrogenase family protein [Agrobacterium vitis]|uniref:alcohol dehydrogenase family protein n=1 Tax=Agrobacterium vitis TaxID=373 RepID=UPI001F445933|nr:alcohol dehydrogenase family protein [Agrobacterium vitis]WEO75294.1 alcohol dehydrogenase family protein [Agrobacterium vitis]